MNGGKASDELVKPNVYLACNDEYLMGARLDSDLLLSSKYHRAGLTKNKKRKVVLDTKAPDYDDIFLDKGTPYAPDDVLEASKPSTLKTPVLSRDEVPSLPSSDIVEAIHYHMSHTDCPRGSCDETALLALGMLVEKWADDLVDENVSACFTVPEESMEGVLLPADRDPQENIGYDSSELEDSESDIISIDLEHSSGESDSSEHSDSDSGSLTTNISVSRESDNQAESESDDQAQSDSDKQSDKQAQSGSDKQPESESE